MSISRNADNDVSIENVVVLQVVSPEDISIRRTKSSKEFTEFDKLNFTLSSMMTATDAIFPPFEVQIDKNYIARIATKNNQWCRAKVENIMIGATRYRVVCYLIDYGEQVTVDKHCLRNVHQRYFDLPAQVKSVSLAGIVPASMYTDTETFNTEIRQSEVWNPSAIQHLKTLIVGRMNVCVEYVHGSAHNVNMYVNDVCVNDELVSRQLAIVIAPPVHQQPAKIYTFEESQEMERQLEEEELRQAALYQPVGAPLAHPPVQISSLSPGIPLQTSPGVADRPATGRGASLLAALEKDALASSNPSMMRLPGTQSIAQTCSPPRPADVGDTLVSGRAASSLHQRLDFGDTSSYSESDGNDGRSSVYKKSRRPNIPQSKQTGRSVSTPLSPPLNSVVSTPISATSTPISVVKAPTMGNALSPPSIAEEAFNGLLHKSDEDIDSGLTVSETMAKGDTGVAPFAKDRAKQTSGVSFSDTEEVKEYSIYAPVRDQGTLLQSSSCDSDELYCPPSAGEPCAEVRVYKKRLGENLDSGNYGTDPDFEVRAISYDQSQARALKKQVTVFSDLPISPIFTIQNSKLHARAIRHWRSLGGHDGKPLRKIQAYSWSVLRRGKELVAITEPYHMEGRDGVSLSYLMAVATLLFDVDSYKYLPDGNGPRCLILCASWAKAEQIYFHVSSIFGEKAERSLLVLHGRRASEHKLSCQLVNGTDVIVSTPSTFVRMLESTHTNVLRLCHLIIDDADIITKEFPTQLSAIMKEVGTAVSNNVERAAPRQLAMFASTWTDLIRVFREEFMTAAATVITSKIEASAACNVKQVVHYIHSEEQRLGTMLGMVDESGTPAIKLVVCTVTDKDACKVYQALHSRSRAVYVAMKSLGDLDKTIEYWEQVRSENSYPILVITDEVLKLLIAEGNPVVDASYVLHYNMPDNKELLGLRLHCLSSNYRENARELMLSSHIIFSSHDQRAATTIVRLLEKSGSDIPSEIRQLSVECIERNESGKKKELCINMKSYGVCRDQMKCTARHIVSSHLDTPATALPTSGDIEFKVISVRNAATYYARIIRHRDMNDVLHHTGSNKFQLDLSLQAYFIQPHVKICIDPEMLEADRLCVYEKDGVYFRAKILVAVADVSTQYIPVAVILLLDEGRILRVKTVNLYELPSDCSLELFPLEIVEIIVCKLKPMDHDIEWSSEVTAYMTSLLQGEVVSGKIQLCLGTTLWCEPIVKRQYLKESGVWVSLWYANLRLLGDVNTGQLATKNPPHVELLRKACEGKVELPVVERVVKASRVDELIPEGTLSPEDTLSPTSDDVLTVATRQLDELEATHIYLSEVDDPSLMFVIRIDQHQRLRDMEDELQTVMRSKGKLKLKSKTLRSLCVAKFPDEDSRWCRCVIMSQTNRALTLLSVDYGRLFEASVMEVSSLPPMTELSALPYQAIECHMPTVMPVEGEWRDSAGDLMWDHCSNCESLYAKVVCKKPAKFIGDTSYGVELIDASSKYDVFVSDLLISNKHAIERKLHILQQLDIEFSGEQLEYPYQQIPKLIRLLNRTESHEKRVLTVQYIHQLVQQSSNLRHEMRRNGIVKNLCTLVNTVNLHDELLFHIIDCFIILTMSNIDNCEEMWWEKGFTYLHELLELCDDNGLLTKVLTCLRHLINSNSIKQEVDSLDSFTINLVHVSRTSTIAQNRVLALDILNVHLQADVKRVAVLLKQDIIRILTGILSINNDELMEMSCHLINSLVSINAKQPSTEPWTNALTHLAAQMFKVTSDSALLSCAKALYTMLKNLNGATAILKDTQLHSKLQRLVNSGLNAQTREACINVLIKVKPDQPPPQADADADTSIRPKSSRGPKSKQTIYLQPIPKDQPQPVKEKRVPTVFWWECSQFLMIQIQVHDALTLDPPPILNYKQGKLHFECGEYQFKLGPIYAKIISRKSCREVVCSEIKYALYKETAELWSKLMKPGYKKPSYVQPNMDLMICSSDDEADIDYTKLPFLIKPKPSLRYSVFESIREKAPSPSEMAPPVEECMTSEEEEDVEEDERYDQSYKTRFDFFNL